MTNDEAPKTELADAELTESDLEQVAGGGNDAFNGQYLVAGTTHTGTTKSTNKVEALTIKQKVID